MKFKTLLIALIGGLLLWGAIGGGVAVADKLIGSSDIRDGSIRKADLRPGVQAQLERKSQPGPVGKTGAQGPKGDPGPAGTGGERDIAGSLGALTFGGVTIEHIGGPFAQRATKVASFDLDKGAWLLTVSGNFDRIDNSQPSSPILQLAVRGVPGVDADLTAWTGNFPATGDREQSASMSRIVFSDGTFPLDVYAFGYNNDGSDAGSGNYTADVEVSAIRVLGDQTTRR